jgi:hypothetical protein
VTTESFEEWTSHATMRAELLSDEDLPRDLPLDHTAESLRRLESVLLETFPNRLALLHAADGELVLGLAAYLGDTLIRAGRGSWAPDPDGDPALVRPAPALDLPAVSPFRLIADAVERRDGRRFVSVFEQWARAAASTPEAAPPRRPSKLDRWLAAREAAFDAWVTAYAPDGECDFSPGSLDAVEQLARGMAPPPESFWDGAVWYIGEVFRRALGGEWTPGFEHTYLREVGPRQAVVVPAAALERALDQPGLLRQRYHEAADLA